MIQNYWVSIAAGLIFVIGVIFGKAFKKLDK